jgi:hypothetical protein
MARVLYSASISEFKGSVKGNTFQRNSSGTIVKGRNLQRFSSSKDQTEAQNRLGRVSSLWNALSPVYKNNWQNDAPFYTRYDFYGRSKKLSGFQWFQLCNNNMLLCGQPTFEDSSSPWVAPTLPLTAQYLTSSDFGFNITGGYDASNSTIVVVASPAVQSTVLASRIPKKIIALLTGSTFTNVDLTYYWESTYYVSYGDLYANSKFVIQVCMYIIDHSTGVSSQYIFMPYFIPA